MKTNVYFGIAGSNIFFARQLSFATKTIAHAVKDVNLKHWRADMEDYFFK